MSAKIKSKKEKTKFNKLIEKSDSETDENEHELSFYINDRVKLMKEVLKIIKPKKIKSMAPDCIKDLDLEEINSMLLEELLGISNKRLKYIFNGQNPSEDSSSTDPEEEKQPIDIISLDDVSEDDFIVEVDSDKSRKKKQSGVKDEPKIKKIKKEKHDKKTKQNNEPLQEENLMSVLELLELQARARAIRSQLMLEANKKAQPESTEVKVDEDSGSDDEAVIIEVPKNEEIVINSSDSETEGRKEKSSEKAKHENSFTETEPQKKKITLIRDRLDKKKAFDSDSKQDVEDNKDGEEENSEATNSAAEIISVANREENTASNTDEISNPVENKSDKPEESSEKDKNQQECHNDDDEIILIVDQEEMDGIIGD